MPPPEQLRRVRDALLRSQDSIAKTSEPTSTESLPENERNNQPNTEVIFTEVIDERLQIIRKNGKKKIILTQKKD